MCNTDFCHSLNCSVYKNHQKDVDVIVKNDKVIDKELVQNLT